MEWGVTRRGFLIGAVGGSLAGGVAGLASASAGQPEAFSPDRHGYGFQNWTPQTQYFETPPAPANGAVRDQVRHGWRDRAREFLDIDTVDLSDALVQAISTQVRLALVQLAGTNGYCYGMVLTAQHYYENPAAIPVDRSLASEIEDPTVPVDDPAAPVYDDIVQLQADQFLRFRAWLGRRAMLHPDWIDTAAILRDVRSVIDAFGTAAVSLFNERLFGHQVLAYDYVDEGDRVVVPIYDPNRAAVTYTGNRPAIAFERSGEAYRMRPYRRYTGMLFNRFDQIERATGREDVGPLDHFTVDRSVVQESMFPLALVLTDTAAVDLTVVDPDGEALDRLRSTHMDVSRGEYARMRSRYGARPGTYRVGVYGKGTTEYAVTARVADAERSIVDETRTATIAPGELHEYALRIPANGPGSFERRRSRSFDPAVAGGAGVAGGVALGAVGYHTLRRRRDGGDGP